MKTNNEIYLRRKENNKRYTAYIPKFLSNPFDEKLKQNDKKFSEWLKENIEKYLKKN